MVKTISTQRLFVMAGAFTAGLVAAFLIYREPMSSHTAAGLSAARELWVRADFADYDATYVMNGSSYEVEVRDRIVTAVVVDGSSARTADLGSYSVPGLFSVLELELENLTDPNGPFRFGLDSVVARVRYHDQFGYVERYLRSGGGQHRGASVEMKSVIRR